MWPFRARASFAQAPAEPAKTPPGGEVAGVGDDDKFGLVYAAAPELTNPDVTLADCPERKDETIYDHYERMLKLDGHLAGLFSIRAADLLTCGWHIEPGGPLARHARLAKWTEERLRGIPHFNEDLEDLLGAVPMGMAISEVMWAQDGPEAKVAELRSRRQRRFTFNRQGQLLLKKNLWDTTGTPVPDRKFLHHTNGRPYESPWGTALLGRCVWPEWFKRKGVRFWALLCEKRAFPPAKGTYDRSRPEDKETLLTAIRTLQAETGVAMPKDVELEFIELSSRVPVDCYKDFIGLMDMWETKIVLGQTLTTGEGEHGTQALGKQHRRTSDDLVARDGIALADTLGTVVKWLVDFNFAEPEFYPTFHFDTDPGDDLDALAKRDEVLAARIGVPVAKSYWYETYGLPEPSEDDPALELAPKPAPVPPGLSDHASRITHHAPLSFRDLSGEDDADALFNRLDADTQRLLELISRDVAEDLRKNSGGRPASAE